MRIAYFPKSALETVQLDKMLETCAVISMADRAEQFLELPKDIPHLKLIFNDCTESHGPMLRAPNAEHAKQIYDFYKRNWKVGSLFCQCLEGVGRSQAVCAALQKIRCENNYSIKANGTYNRLLYRLILEAATLTPEPVPLVSMAVRVKYPVDRLNAFTLSMKRQRHEKVEIIAVSDGLFGNAKYELEGSWDIYSSTETIDSTARDGDNLFIYTPEAKGYWGHPYRQLALDNCRGEYIGMSNDDNYYCPGYIEQMLLAMEMRSADIAMCETVHSYSGWSVCAPGSDLGCWIAKRDLVMSTPWSGNEFTSDRDYMQALIDRAAGHVAVVKKPLFVHN